MKVSNPNRVKVLLICMGNICRSPTAHAVFRHLVNEHGLSEVIEIDSAGTHAYHIGNPPDSRSMQTARKRGIEMSDLRARQVDLGDFYHYDYLIAMDDYNMSLLKEQAPADTKHKLSMFLSFAPHLNEREVPDPYYGGADGFELVFDMVQAASEGLLAHIKQQHLGQRG